MRPVDRTRPPEPTKRKSFAVEVRFFAGFSELINLSSGANAAFCEGNNSVNFVFFELKGIDESKCCFKVTMVPKIYTEDEGYNG